MQKLLLFIDRVSTWVGQAFAWCIVLLTLSICYEVASRYLFNHPTSWVFDTSYMLYGTLFMMAGAYTLAKNGHVRGDVLYGFFSPRVQAAFDLVLYLVFFVPGMVALVYAGTIFAHDAWLIREHSSVSAEGPPIYHFKTILPIAGAMLLLQGLVEIARCVVCLRQGAWPSREQDVEEVDVDKLKEQVKVSDEDIAALDQYVVGTGAPDAGAPEDRP